MNCLCLSSTFILFGLVSPLSTLFILAVHIKKKIKSYYYRYYSYCENQTFGGFECKPTIYYIFNINEVIIFWGSNKYNFTFKIMIPESSYKAILYYGFASIQIFVNHYRTDLEPSRGSLKHFERATLFH